MVFIVALVLVLLIAVAGYVLLNGVPEFPVKRSSAKRASADESSSGRARPVMTPELDDLARSLADSGVTQAEIAQRIGVHPSTVSRHLAKKPRGRRRSSTRTAA